MRVSRDMNTHNVVMDVKSEAAHTKRRPNRGFRYWSHFSQVKASREATPSIAVGGLRQTHRPKLPSLCDHHRSRSHTIFRAIRRRMTATICLRVFDEIRLMESLDETAAPKAAAITITNVNL